MHRETTASIIEAQLKNEQLVKAMTQAQAKAASLEAQCAWLQDELSACQAEHGKLMNVGMDAVSMAEDQARDLHAFHALLGHDLHCIVVRLPCAWAVVQHGFSEVNSIHTRGYDDSL